MKPEVLDSILVAVTSTFSILGMSPIVHFTRVSTGRGWEGQYIHEGTAGSIFYLHLAAALAQSNAARGDVTNCRSSTSR
jgi:hypothetical protein